LKSLPIKMEFCVNEDFPTQKGIDLLNDFFSKNISNNITISDKFIYVDTVRLFVVDDEFEFLNFFEKSEKEIEDKIHLYNIFKKKSTDKWDIFHRYKVGYEKYKILFQLLKNCEYYNIITFDKNGDEISISLYHTIFSF